MQSQSTSATEYCPKCGLKIASWAKFCPRCGQPIGSGTSDLPVSSTQQSSRQVKAKLGIYGWSARIVIIGFLLVASNMVKTMMTDSMQAEKETKATIDIVKRAEQGIPDPDKSSYSVQYEIKSALNQKFSVTYSNEGGGTSQLNGVSADVPVGQDGVWRMKLTVPKGSSLYISAQNQEDSGVFLVSIYVDGIAVKQSLSDGAYAIATCSYQL